MPTAETKRRIVSCVMFVLPLVLVKSAGMVLGGPGPSSAAAAPSESAAGVGAAVSPRADPEPSGAEEAAVRYIASLREEPFGPSPLYFQREEATAPEVEEGEPELTPPPEFTVQAIMASSSGNTALINGRPHRVDDPVGGTSWVIIGIDAAARSVTIEDSETGRTETRGVQ